MQGSCSTEDSEVQEGENSITLSTLSVGTYSDCSVVVTDSSDNESESLSITSFTISAIEVEEEVEEEDAELELVELKMSGNKKTAGGKYKYGTKIKIKADTEDVKTIVYRWNNKGDWKKYKKTLVAKSGTNKLSWRGLDSDGNILFRDSKTFRVTKPDAVNSYRGELLNPHSLRIVWSSSHTDVSEFKIYRSTTENFELSDEFLIGTNKSNDRDYTDSSVPFSGFYFYKIVAVDDSGEILDWETLASYMNSGSNLAHSTSAVFTPSTNNIGAVLSDTSMAGEGPVPNTGFNMIASLIISLVSIGFSLIIYNSKFIRIFNIRKFEDKILNEF